MSNRDSVPEFTIGFTLGVAFGLVVGFIFAPQRGRETRDLIKDKASDIPGTVRELTADRKKVYRQTWKGRKGKPIVSDTYFE